MNKDFTKNLLDLWANPLFAQGFLEFSTKMQQWGLEAARQAWQANHQGDTFLSNAPDVFEPMFAFYSQLGFVPKRQHDEVVKENEQLKKENEFLKNTLRELNLKVLTQGNLKLQELWQETAQKQLEVSAEIAKNMLDLFKQDSEK